MQPTLLLRRTVMSALLFGFVGSGWAKDGEKFIFCSYNVRNWLKMERFIGGQRMVSDKPEEEKKAVIRILKEISPDILGLCEVGDEADVADLQRRLKKAGVDLPHVERIRGSDPVRSLALLSRLPIVARNSRSDLGYMIRGVAMPFQIQRGLLDATVELSEGFQVRFIGVHLKSMREVVEADQAVMRRNEATLLREHLDQTLLIAPKSKILCYGDFNEHRNEPAISIIMGKRNADSHMLELVPQDVNGQVWTHFWDAADSYARLDYIFSSRALRPHLNEEESRIYHETDFLKASDHRPIVLPLSKKP